MVSEKDLLKMNIAQSFKQAAAEEKPSYGDIAIDVICYSKVEKFTVEDSDGITEYIVIRVPDKLAYWIKFLVGKKGATVRKVEERCGAKIIIVTESGVSPVKLSRALKMQADNLYRRLVEDLIRGGEE